MTHIENYCTRELTDLRAICKEICIKTDCIPLKEINTIALVEINRELDGRKIRKEGIGKFS